MRFSPFPEILTDRLRLRKLTVSDCDEILELRSDETINQYISRPKSRQTNDQEAAISFIQTINKSINRNENIMWSIDMVSQPRTIGTICLWNFSEAQNCAEIGYDLNLAFHRKGLMNEAMNAVLDFGFKQLNLEKIVAFTHRENESSCKLLIRNGFKLNVDLIDETNVNNVIFELGSRTPKTFSNEPSV